MKKLLGLIVAIVLVSCSDRIQVQYMSGQVITIRNVQNIPVSIGDTIIVENYVSSDTVYGVYSSSVFWGRYVDTIPEKNFFNSKLITSRTWYQLGIVIKD